jgi:cytochrome P450
MQESASIAIDEWESTLDKSALEDTESSQFSIVHRHNIFQTILKSSLPPQEKTPKRLGQEGFVAIAAGGETCGRMMTNALYHILANKDRVMPILAKELAEAMPTPDVRPDLKDLERMPYLVRPPPLV